MKANIYKRNFTAKENLKIPNNFMRDNLRMELNTVEVF
jgi:hypothetical protein